MLVAQLQIEPGIYREVLKKTAVNLSCISRFKAATEPAIFPECGVGIQNNGMRNWTTSCHVPIDKSDYTSVFITERLPLLVRLCDVFAYGPIDPTESTFNYPPSTKHYTGVLYFYDITLPL